MSRREPRHDLLVAAGAIGPERDERTTWEARCRRFDELAVDALIAHHGEREVALRGRDRHPSRETADKPAVIHSP